jgi:hypothetical protein
MVCYAPLTITLCRTLRQVPWAVRDETGELAVDAALSEARPPEDSRISRSLAFPVAGTEDSVESALAFGPAPVDRADERFFGREIVTSAATVGALVTLVGRLRVQGGASAYGGPVLTGSFGSGHWPLLTTTETIPALVRRLRSTGDTLQWVGSALMVVGGVLVAAAVVEASLGRGREKGKKNNDQ